MSVINTGTFAKDNWPGVKAWFGLAYKQHPTEYTEIFDKEISDKAYEEYVGASGLGLLSEKAEGESISYDTMAQGFVNRLTNIVYALGFMVSYEAIKNGQGLKVAKKGSQSLGRSVRSTRETIGANILNRAFTSAYAGGDGLELCSTLHLNAGGAGGTYQNELTSAADLSEAALEQALIDIDDWEDDKGLKIAAKGMKLIVKGDNRYEAERILKSELQNDTANNAINALRSTGVLPQGFVVNHYVTDADAWFIKTDVVEGLIYQEREPDKFDIDSDFDTRNAKYGAFCWYTYGWGDPKGIYGSPGA